MDAVAELADVITLCAQAQAEDAASSGRASGRRAPRRRLAAVAGSRRRAATATRGGRAREAAALAAMRPRAERRRCLTHWTADKVRARYVDARPAGAAVPKQTPKSKYTADRRIPGAFEGETVTRRRFMTGTAQAAGGIAAAAFALPALGFALGPIFEETGPAWQAVGPLERLHRRHLRAAHVITHRPPASARPARRRSTSRQRNPAVDKEPRDEYNAVRRDLDRAACTSAARCASSQAAAALHLPVPRRRLRLRRQVAGGPPVRPLDRFYTRVERRPVLDRPALQRQLRAAALLARATRASRSTASASTSTRRVPTTRKLPGT